MAPCKGNSHLKLLDKEERVKPKARTTEEMTKTAAELHALETTNQSKRWLLGRLNKIDKHLANPIQKKERKDSNPCSEN